MDPIKTEIMKNRFTAIVEEASTVAYRTAHTTFVKQTQDYQVALARLSGEYFAFPTMSGAIASGGQTIKGLLQHFPEEELRPGDVLISNDPFSTWGLVTHQMDIHLVRPIFVNGKVACYGWSFVHATDIGGSVAGSISPELFECFQEGFRIRPTKLYNAGVINQDIVNFIHDNSRIGDDVWGDLEALMSAMRLLDRRINELCTKFGCESFFQGVDDVMSYSELKARSVISELSDGEYSFTDYIEGNDDGEAVNITCKLTIKGDEASIDYTGSSPQVYASLNFSTGSRTHPLLCLGLTNYIQTMEPSMSLNGGMMRPIKAYAPHGTVMNAGFPAAMGNRFVCVMRIYDTLIGCINQATPKGVAACGAGQSGIVSSAWLDRNTGGNRVAVVEPISGGSGGRYCADGVDATDTMVGFMKSTPVEHVEIETPLIVRRFELVPSRFGHGQYRGGASVCIDIEGRTGETAVAVRGLDRFRFQPWGAFGGYAGHSCVTTLNPNSNPQNLGRLKVTQLRKGQVLRIVSPSGGGFGSPLLRDPHSVLRDVLDEMLTEEEALSIYGVIIVNRSVDIAATQIQRGATPKNEFAVMHGPARNAYELQWPVEASVALAKGVLSTPVAIRRLVLDMSRANLNQEDGPLTALKVMSLVEKVAKGA